MLESLEGRRGVAISGTHGKTTTTGMAASVFLAAKEDPTILIGGDWGPIGGNARAGNGPHFLAEACEAFDSFLELHPHVALLTNPEVGFRIGDTMYHLPEGEAIEVNNLGIHAVRNDGTTDRIHLIFEYYDLDQPDPDWIRAR